MGFKRKLTRRSFLAQVIGGTAVAGAALTLVGGRAEALQVTDHDPTDQVGHGRGGGTGMTDSDSGPGADPAGRGRGGGPRQDGRSGVTDSDSGPNADPAGNGRGGGGGGASYQERQDSCDRLRQLEAQYRADLANSYNTRTLGELRRIQDAIIQHCS